MQQAPLPAPQANTHHVPILLTPIVDALIEPFSALAARSEPHWLVDCTLGGGGHTHGFLTALACRPGMSHHRVLALDQDRDAISRAQIRFKKEIQEGRLVVQHARFSQLPEFTQGLPVLGLLADLGFSSDQMDSAERGLSFMKEGPLDMRLDPTQGFSCLQYLQMTNESDLADAIFAYGEERFSRRIAAAIVQARKQSKLPKTSTELAELVTRAMPGGARHGRIHPATRTFQALRIVVNQELEELDSLLKHGIMTLKAGGRAAVLSFHSLEDRRVKQAFKDRDSVFESLWKKPLAPDEDEIRANPRSRSAKLRVAVRKAN